MLFLPGTGEITGLTLHDFPGDRELAVLWIDLSALVVRHRYLHLLVRGVTTAVGAGDGSRIDASVARTFALRSKLHMMIIHHNPVWRCIPTSAAKDWFIAGHTERAGTDW